MNISNVLSRKEQNNMLKEKQLHVTLFRDGKIIDYFVVKHTATVWDWCTRAASERIKKEVQAYLELDGLWTFDPDHEYFIVSPIDYVQFGDIHISDSF